MKRLIIIGCLVGVCLTVSGQGIEFIKGDLKEALKKAKAENKQVFIDFTATWCVPCKQMEENVFSKEEAGTYYNEHFVCCQIDIDQYKEIAKKYGIRSIPTVLYLNPNGKEVKRVLGTMGLPRFLHTARVVKGEEASFEKIYESYKKDRVNPELQQGLLYEAPFYLNALDKTEKEIWQKRLDAIYDEYLANKSPEDLINERDFAIMKFFEKIGKRNERVEYMIQQQDAYLNHIPVAEFHNFVVGYKLKQIEYLAMTGDTTYRVEIARMGNDLKPFFGELKKNDLELTELLTFDADAFYQIYARRNQDAYVGIKKAYFERIGENSSAKEYQDAVMHLFTPTRGRLNENAAKECLVWLDKLLAGEQEAVKQVQWLSMMGDCYSRLSNKTEAKAAYNQAYMTSLQVNNPGLRQHLYNKMKSFGD